MTEAQNQRLFDLRPTPAEEEIWLLQEQRPDHVLKRLTTWQLRVDVDLTRLLKALRETIERLPALNARYRFDDKDAELRKIGSAEWLDCVKIQHARSRAETTDLLLARQVATFLSDSHPPFEAVIVFEGGAVFLALLLHDLACASYHEDQIVAVIVDAYADVPVKAPAPRSGAPLRSSGEAKPPLPSITRGAGEDLVVRSSIGEEGEARTRALAYRWSITVETDRMFGSLDLGTGADALLSKICARFANFIAGHSGYDELTLRILSSDAAFDVSVRRGAQDADIDRDVVELISRSSIGTAAATWGGLSERFDPLIQVRIGCSPAEAEDRRRLFEQPLALPTHEACIDLELAVEFDNRAAIRLTLTTGQGVSPHAGRHLVSRFAGSLIDEAPANGRPAQPSTRAARSESPDVESRAEPDPAMLILAEFRQVLDSPSMSASDDFFDFGGHSLLATRIIGRLRSAHGLELNFADFFMYPTAAELAATAVAAARPTGRHNREKDLSRAGPLALAQASLWRAYAAHEFGAIFNLPFAIEFLDEVDEAVLATAFHDLVERHTSLRTTFQERDGEALQEIVPVAALPGYDWFWPASTSGGVELQDEAGYRFDLARELPLRVRILRDARSGRQVLSLLVHHLVIDEWSLNVMMQDLGVAYRSRQARRPPAWDAPAPSFLAFAQHQSEHHVDRDHLAYWTDLLQGDFVKLKLPASDGEVLSETGDSGAKAGWLEYKLEPDLVEDLHAIGRRNKVSLFNLVYAAIASTLCHLGQRNEIVVGTSASGRTDPRYFETVGYFTTMVAHRMRLDEDASVGAFVEYVRDTINASMPYADVPIEHIQQALGRSQADGLVFDVYVQIHANNALNGSIMTIDDRAIRYRQIDADKTESMFKMQFEIMEDVIETNRSVRLIVTYKRPDYTTSQVEHVCMGINKTLEALANPDLVNTSLRQIFTTDASL